MTTEVRDLYDEHGKFLGWTSYGYTKLYLFKAIRSNRKIKKGQKLWTSHIWTGANGSWVVCKYRGTGRWIKPFVHWEFPNQGGKTLAGGLPEVKYLGEIEVSEKFFYFIDKLSDGPWS